LRATDDALRVIVAVVGGPRVFISYAEENAPVAARIAEVLRAGGYDAWLDRTHLDPAPLSPAILAALESSDLFLAIITEEYAAKFERGAYVRREADWALAKLAALGGGEPFVLLVRAGPEPTQTEPRDSVQQLLKHFGLSFRSFNGPADEPGLLRTVFRALEGRGRLGLTIEVIAGPDLGAVFRKALSMITIGRAEGNTVRLTDPKVSGAHADIQVRRNAVVMLRDVSGSHTIIRGRDRQERLERRSARMADGDVVTMGATELRVTFNDLAGRAPTTTKDV
jgi:hypothetical protein